MLRIASESDAIQQASGFRPTAAGTVRDLRERTDLARAIAFFGSREEARAFAGICLSRTLPLLPGKVRYVDYGGGQGVVASAMQDALRAAGRATDVTVVDANPRYLADAAALGLNVHLANIEDCALGDVDLATMRLVNHYCSRPQQAAILRAIHDALRPGGVFVSQIETGRDAICRLQTRISNALSEEGGAGYHWPTLEEYFAMAKEAGFVDAVVIGESAAVESTINEGLAAAWRRFHGSKLEALAADGRMEETDRLLAQRAEFFRTCHRMVAEALDISAGDASSHPALAKFELRYPIVCCRRSG
ncbi:MAG: class I SAM-dependent methyltransferase [Pseudomonadota bacterium]